MLIKQSSAVQNLVFLMVDATDHLTGKTGLSPAVTLSKNGGAFASPSGSVSEIGNGWYQVAGHASDSSTLGPLALHATAAGADPVDMLYEVIACDLHDAAGLGLSRMDAAISTRSTYAGSDTAGVTTLLTRLPDTLSLANVNAQLDSALADYDAPTQSEMAAAFTQIKGSGWSSETDTLKDIADGSGGGGSGSDPLASSVPGSYAAGSAGDALARIYEIKTIVQAGEEQ